MTTRSFSRRFLAPFAALAFALLVGRITDQTTGQPLEGLRVSAVGPTHSSVRTDADGRYVLRNLHPGRYTIVVRGKGVPTVRAGITVSDRTLKKNFVVCNVALDYSCANPPQRR
ncbi:MAG: hypothetical protein HKL92_00120 [Candidatus Eremiobacteraeota bacterium]|nr:carboxypeptidase regulatory-like domain-containing protein [Candidatus Eremiobacteraeota bacterium]NNM91723.1 hypothetical protein [Candidatus Eremiobacteraeota bacterium]